MTTSDGCGHPKAALAAVSNVPATMSLVNMVEQFLLSAARGELFVEADVVFELAFQSLPELEALLEIFLRDAAFGVDVHAQERIALVVEVCVGKPLRLVPLVEHFERRAFAQVVARDEL